MKIREALIESVHEEVSARNVIGGRALMHGRVSVVLLALLEDGRIVRFRFHPEGTLSTFAAILGQWGAQFAGMELPEALIIEDIDNPSSTAEMKALTEISKEVDLGI